MTYSSPYQFAFFRLILGSYLIVHFARLLPYAAELFSKAGMIPDTQLLPTRSSFPDPLFIFDSPLSAQIFVVILMVLSAVFTTGKWRQLTALLVWFGWACLVNRNISIANPGLCYVGWLVLACAIIAPGEALVLGKKHHSLEPWALPWLIFFGAWLLLATGYGLGGLLKLQSPSWIDGTALSHVLKSPLARDNFLHSAILALPPLCLKICTWAYLSLELAFLPLCLLSCTRTYAWLLMVVTQLANLSVMNNADLSLGILMMHLFVFDARWLKPRVAHERPIVFFDGVCGLCNWFVDLALSEDKAHNLLFAPLQGKTAASKVGALELKNLESIILYDNHICYRQSDAVLRVLSYLGGLWRLLELARIFPRPLRDRVYHFIATHRYQWFGKHDSCRLPTPVERQYFVD